MKARKNIKGFTLIEVIAVLAILAILAAIGLPTMHGFIDSSKESICEVYRSGLVRHHKLYQISKQGDAATIPLQNFIDREFIDAKNDVNSYKRCPLGGAYYTEDGIRILCSKHGGTSTDGEDTDNGGGELGDGSITLTDSTGKQHILQITGDWEAIKLTMQESGWDGTSITPGTVVSDHTGTYLFYGWNGSIKFPNINDAVSLKDLANHLPNQLMKVETTSKIWIEEDIGPIHGNIYNQGWPFPPQKGDICYYKGSYYVSPTGCNQNTLPPNGWLKVEQSK